jgi:hypothetical protein
MTEVSGASNLVAAREKVIAGIGSPLGFFVLALLIVETFLYGAGSAFNLPVETRTYMVWAGLGVFLVIVCIVLMLVILFPKNLVFTEKSHLELAALYGAKSKPVSAQAIEASNLTAPHNPLSDQLQQLQQPPQSQESAGEAK